MDQRFRWDERLHRRQDFRTVFREGRRLSRGGLVLWVYRHMADGAPKPRLGLAIPRTFGIAVRRNRLKRILREIFRLNKARLPSGTDLIFSARPMAQRLEYRLLEPLVTALWTKANLLPDAKASPSSPPADSSGSTSA